MTDTPIFDGEIEERAVNSSNDAGTIDPRQLQIMAVSEWLDEVEGYNPDIAEEIRQLAKMFLPENIDELGVRKYQGLKIWRVLENNDIKYVSNEFPLDCPVRPLGKSSDGIYYFLDSSGDLIGSNIKGQTELEGLFGFHVDYLHRAWPSGESKRVGNEYIHNFKGYYSQFARQCLIKECSRLGKFDPQNKVRGRGGWLDDEGRLVIHLGDAVLVNGVLNECGEIGEHIYPSRPAMPRPTQGTAKEMQTVLELLQKWKWVRPVIDPILLLGWIGTAVLTGALEWRPMVFVDASKGAGKTTLQKTIRALLKGRLHEMEGATEAALRSAMGIDAVAVSYDEAENDPSDPDRMAKIMRLARLAASGGRDTKGTKDQGLREFTLRAPMIFSAINLPRMTGADADRFAFLKIQKLPKSAAKFEGLTPAQGVEIGQKLAGRMVSAWGRWQETFTNYHELLIEQGHTSRSADQFGTLLAAADCILYDKNDGERQFEICQNFRADTLAECQNTDPNWFLCYRHVLQFQPEVWRDTFPSIGEVIKKCFAAINRNMLSKSDPAYAEENETLEKLKVKLNKAGLHLVTSHKNGLWLAIPDKHIATNKIFARTDWSQWSHALSHAPADVYRRQQVVIDGQKVHSTQLRLDGYVELDDGDRRKMFETGEDDESGDDDDGN